MKSESKIQYAVAIFLVLGSFALALMGFLTPPAGEISESVLWYSAQALMFAATIFGVGSMLKEFYSHAKN